MQDQSDPYGESLDLRALVQGLARSTSWILVLTFVGIVGGLGYGLLKKNEYVSLGKIEVRLGIRERRTPESTLNPLDTPAPTPGIGDELELLYNPEVYRRIAAEIGHERLLSPYDPAGVDQGAPAPARWLHAAQSWWFGKQAAGSLNPEQALKDAAALAAEAIKVSALNGTSYLLIQSTASTPEMAQLLTNTYVAVARQWHREVYSSKTELTFVTDRLARYEGESLTAETAFSDHRENCGFYDLETQKRSLIANLDEHVSRLRENTIHHFEIEDELAFVDKELESTPATIEKLIPPSVTVNPEYQAALGQLQKLSSERAGLVSIYTEGSEIFQRKALQIDNEINRVETRLSDLPELIEYGSVIREDVPNPRYEELSIRSIELGRERKTLTIAVELWQQSKKELEERLRAAQMCEPIHRDLTQAMARANSRVLELSTALERAEAIALLDRQEDMDSLRIAMEGNLPRGKEGPDRKRFLIFGLAGGLAAGIFLATLRFLMDTRLHDPSALQEALGLELIGVVPETRKARLRVRVRKAARA